MSAFPVGCRVAQAIGITGAAWLAGNYWLRSPRNWGKTNGSNSGNIAALSTISIPPLIQGHKDDQISTVKTARVWKALFERGKSQNPPIAAATASAFVYLAWSVRSGTSLSRVARPNASILYGLAAVLTIGIVPYTFVAMSTTNNALLAKAEGKSTENAEEDLRKWASLNAGRSLFPLTAGLLGIFATLF